MESESASAVAIKIPKHERELSMSDAIEILHNPNFKIESEEQLPSPPEPLQSMTREALLKRLRIVTRPLEEILKIIKYLHKPITVKTNLSDEKMTIKFVEREADDKDTDPGYNWIWLSGVNKDTLTIRDKEADLTPEEYSAIVFDNKVEIRTRLKKKWALKVINRAAVDSSIFHFEPEITKSGFFSQDMHPTPKLPKAAT